MILHDNNIVSTFAKIRRVDLLFTVFNRVRLQLSSNVERELRDGVKLGYLALQDILDLIDKPQPNMTFEVHSVSPAERALYHEIPFYPLSPSKESKGEVDTVALAWTHRAVIVSNERKVYNFCRTNAYQVIPCLRLEDILRGLWTHGHLNRSDVLELITEIESVDRVVVVRTEVF